MSDALLREQFVRVTSNLNRLDDTVRDHSARITSYLARLYTPEDLQPIIGTPDFHKFLSRHVEKHRDAMERELTRITNEIENRRMK